MGYVAARSFIAHLRPHHRRFREGEVVPDEWAEGVGARHLLIEVDDDPVEAEDDGQGDAEPDAVEPQRSVKILAGPFPPAMMDRFNDEFLTASVDRVVGWVLDDAEEGTRHQRASYAWRVEEDGKGEDGRKTLFGQLGEIIASEPGGTA